VEIILKTKEGKEIRFKQEKKERKLRSKSNTMLIFDIKENELTYNRQLIYQQIYIMNV